MIVMTKEMESEKVEINNDSDTDPSKESDDCDDIENAGWADSIAKILKSKKPQGKKTLVLSKGKKFSTTTKKVSKVEFEIETPSGEIKQETILTEENTENSEDVSKVHLRKRKRELPTLRKKPNILNKGREKTLCNVATKGVVQLFNAIKSQQADINKKLQEAGPMEIKRDKVLKNVDKQAFLDILMGERSESVTAGERSKGASIAKAEKPWNVLRDDFMMGAKLKDWDKELESENEIEMECN